MMKSIQRTAHGTQPEPQSPVLVIDVGMTQVKVMIFAMHGELVAVERRSYPTRTGLCGESEQDPSQWWGAILSCMRALVDAYPGQCRDLAAIVATGHMHALVVTSGDGQVLFPALTLADRRSRDEVARLANAVPAGEFHAICGTRPDPSLPLFKLCWLQRAHPELFQKISRVYATKDYIRSLLTGDYATDPVDACAFGGYDVVRNEWSGEVFQAVGLSTGLLPAICLPTQQTGTLRPEVAAQFGITPGLPVFAGAGDDVEVLGFGMGKPGLAVEHFGTTGSILLGVQSPVVGLEMSLELYPHSIPRQWIVGGSTNHAASALAWVDSVLATRVPEQESRVRLQPGETLPVFIPHLSGRRCPDWDPAGTGAWMGLRVGHSAADLRLGARFGVAASLRAILEPMRKAGVFPCEIRVVPPPSSESWQRDFLAQRSALYGCDLAIVNQREPTGWGSALLAATGLGFYPDLITAVDHTVEVVDTVKPDNCWREAALAYWEEYRSYTEKLL